MTHRRYVSPLSKINPIWRGIGFLLLIIIPLLAYGFAGLILDYLVLHGIAHPVGDQIVRGVDNLYLQLGITVLLTLLLYLVFSLIASAVYSLSGASEDKEVYSRIGPGRKKF